MELFNEAMIQLLTIWRFGQTDAYDTDHKNNVGIYMIVIESIFLFSNLILVIIQMLKNYMLIFLNFKNQRYPVLKYELIEKWLDFRDDFIGPLCPCLDKHGLLV